MTVKTLPLIAAFSIIGVLLLGVSQQATTNSSGAPTNNVAGNGYAGAPAENGRTCATSGCHNGPATAKAGMITVQGLQGGAYIPGETYIIEVGTSEPSQRWGFQAAVQTPTGDAAGTLATRDNETRLPQVAGYITHTTAGNAGNNTKSWSFDWTAPAAGTGDVGVYVAINASNANGTTSGDNILFDELIMQEGQPTGIEEAPATWQIAAIQILGQQLQVTVQGHTSSPIQVEVFTINGQQVAAQEMGAWHGQTTFSVPLTVASGLYLVRLRSEQTQWVQKVAAL